MIGANKEHLNDIKSDLPKNITTKFIYKKNSPTIVKKGGMLIILPKEKFLAYIELTMKF